MTKMDIWREGEHWRFYDWAETSPDAAKLEFFVRQHKWKGRHLRAMSIKTAVGEIYDDTREYNWAVYFTLPKGAKRTTNDKYRLRDTSVEIEIVAKKIGAYAAAG